MVPLHRYSIKLVPLVVVLCALTGCTRHFFRERADADVECLLAEKNQIDQWAIENWHVYPHPDARFADPSNPDRPPMPPDDPVAKALSPNPQRPRRAGVALMEGTGYLDLLAAWDSMNRAEDELEKLPAPDPVNKSGVNVKPSGIIHAQYCEPAQDGPAFKIKLEQAVELGLINSFQYQDQRELLYLAALPVSLQRFSFAAQFLSNGDVFREETGAKTPLGRRERWRADFNPTNGNTISKLFPTGALLLFKLANQTVVEMANGHTNTSISNLSLDLTQPLLRGGGFAVNLEPLTQAERNLLYAIRSYARFRKVFFVSLAAGNDASSAATTDVAAGLGLAPGSVTPTAGYLPTVLRDGQMEVDRRNVLYLEGVLRQYEAFAEGGTVSQLQVDQVKQQLLSGRSKVLNDELVFRNTLDNLKRQLGLPPELQLDIDISALKPMREQLDRYQEVIEQYRAVQDALGKVPPENEADKLRLRFHSVFQKDPVTQGTPFRQRIIGRWSVWEKKTDPEVADSVKALREERRKLLDQKTLLETDQKPVPDALRARIATIDDELNLVLLEVSLRDYEKKPWQKAPAELRDIRRLSLYRAAANSFVLVLVEARNDRFVMLRQAWPKLPPLLLEDVDLLSAPLETAYTRASQAALTNRWDLMNTRAQLVDSWRQIGVQANSLLGTLTVDYHVDSSTPANQAKPFGFAGKTSTQRLGLNWELPLVRRLERNNYRTALINFQRERRSLMATEDSILTNLRSEIRQLRVFAETYQIQLDQVALAYAVVENSLDTVNEPSEVGKPPPDPAGRTLQLLNSISSLNQAQNTLYSIWINYFTNRMQLYRDLELMPLDTRGVWTDEDAIPKPVRRSQPGESRPPDFIPEREQLPQPRPIPAGQSGTPQIQKTGRP